jgi:6,7-dimethyl-8-ribityllumazine synthase
VKKPPEVRAAAAGLRILLLRSAFNARVVEGLARGALSALRALGAERGAVDSLEVPGAFELPLAARLAAGSGRYDAIVALGAVIRGETDHYEHVARAAADGLLRASSETGVPVGFGVLTVRKPAQALARARSGPHNKGAEAARAAVAMVDVVRRLAASPARAVPARRRGGRARAR